MAQEKKHNKTLRDFITTMIFPLLVNKAFMLYFGLNYAEYPGEGYGYGLAATVVVLIVTTGSFLWRYRNIEDP